MSKLYTLSKTESSFISEASDTFIAVMDAIRLTNMATFYTEIAEALKFPDYFGENLDALDEMLYDLDWIEQSSILILIKNSEYLLANEPDKKQAIVKLIQEIDNPYFEVCFL